MKNCVNQNWFKVGILLVGLLIVVLSILFYNSLKSSRISLRVQCAGLAGKFFEDKFGRDYPSNVDYINHYSLKHDKCFMLTKERFFDLSGTSETLYDVFDRTAYAEGSFGVNDYQFKKSYCAINGEDCKSRADFDRYVSEYMEN